MPGPSVKTFTFDPGKIDSIIADLNRLNAEIEGGSAQLRSRANALGTGLPLPCGLSVNWPAVNVARVSRGSDRLLTTIGNLRRGTVVIMSADYAAYNRIRESFMHLPGDSIYDVILHSVDTRGLYDRAHWEADLSEVARGQLALGFALAAAERLGQGAKGSRLAADFSDLAKAAYEIGDVAIEALSRFFSGASGLGRPVSTIEALAGLFAVIGESGVLKILSKFEALGLIPAIALAPGQLAQLFDGDQSLHDLGAGASLVGTGLTGLAVYGVIGGPAVAAVIVTTIAISLGIEFFGHDSQHAAVEGYHEHLDESLAQIFEVPQSAPVPIDASQYFDGQGHLKPLETSHLLPDLGLRPLANASESVAVNGSIVKP